MAKNNCNLPSGIDHQVNITPTRSQKCTKHKRTNSRPLSFSILKTYIRVGQNYSLSGSFFAKNEKNVQNLSTHISFYLTPVLARN
jgi:hypothetical protein